MQLVNLLHCPMLSGRELPRCLTSCDILCDTLTVIDCVVRLYLVCTCLFDLTALASDQEVG